MKKLLLTAACLSSLAVSVALATPIQVAYNPVLTQPANNGIGTVTSWVTTSINTFNTVGYPGAPLPTPLESLAFKVQQSGPGPTGWTFGTNVDSIQLDLTNYQYIVVSWGSTKIPNDGGTADYLYYIGDTNLWTFHNLDASGDGAAALATGGLSSIVVYGSYTPSPPVPDGGTTLALLGLGLLGLGFMARRNA